MDTGKPILVGLRSPLVTDLDFNKFKAKAMVCDNGAILPSVPVAGQWFYHTPTGRSILMQYNGSEWISIISLGTMTIYVDKTDGTDDMVHGGAVNAGAFKTVQYAVNRIPGLVGGNVIININEESYLETVTFQGKFYTSDYTITLQGTLSAHATNVQESSVKGVTSTYGSITDTGEFSGHADVLLYSSNNAEYKVIDVVTADKGTIVGYWTNIPTGNYTIYNWGTTITQLVIKSGQIGIVCKDIKISNTGTCVYAYDYSYLTLYRCWVLSTVGNGVVINGLGNVWLWQCYISVSAASTAGVYAIRGGICIAIDVKIVATYIYANCVMVDGESQFIMGAPCVIDGTTGGGRAQTGFSVRINSYIEMNLLYSKIRNCDIGVYAVTGGQVQNAANIQYSGNGVNETAVAASYGYID